MSRQLLEKILSVALELGGINGETLRSSVHRMKFSSNKELRLALRLVGEAHIALFDLSPRDAINAIPLFVESGAEDSLKRLSQIALDRGNLRIANAIYKLDRRLMENISSLQFTEWVQSFAIKWFDLFVDEEQNIAFIAEEDQELIRQVISEHFDEGYFWNSVMNDIERDARYPAIRRDLLRLIVDGREPAVTLPGAPDHAGIFERFADENGLMIIRQIQMGGVGGRMNSDVFFVEDSDGITKVFKRLIVSPNNPVRCYAPSEDEIFRRLSHTRNLVRPSRFLTIEGDRYAVFPTIYGRSSSSGGQILSAIGDIVRSVSDLHSAGIAHGDIRYQNLVIDQDGSGHLIDLGSVYVIRDRLDSVPVLLEDCKFATPECIKLRRGSTASDIFQLGVLLASGILGRHPFALPETVSDGSRESETLRYAWPLCLSNPSKEDFESLPEYIRRMLSLDPSSRPSAEDVCRSISVEGRLSIVSSTRYTPHSSSEKQENDDRPVVLFPARMGIPHKGHIEYIRRLIFLGFHVKISLQRSYTLTDRDPIPKWVVMKMVGRSLLDGGCSSEDFSFIFTPFFETDQEMRVHFALMPGRENVVALASGNSGTSAILPDLPLLDQRNIFGTEGEDYENRSWGEILRRAVRENDRKVFEEYVASGVLKIRSLEELRNEYHQIDLPFLSGRVRLILNGLPLSSNPEEIRLLVYLGPEESIRAHLKWKGFDVSIEDPYARETIIRINKINYRLLYSASEIVEGDLLCSFSLETV